MRRAAASAAALALLALLWQSAPAPAGHGLATSFAAIEWLPPPGRTPDGFFYFLDGWSEERELRAAGGRKETVAVSLRIAREKLAEIEEMVQAANAPAARVAVERYAALVGRALAAVQGALAPGAAPGEDAADLVRSLCQALLEHQYIVSVDYETLPRADRGVLASVVEQADAAYRTAALHLSQRDRESFFFKEGEVRWSLRAGMREE